MEVHFYKNFVKKYNSTKRPTGTYTAKQCRMKEECSVKNPVLLIETVDLDVNYAYFNNRYYFVEDIILNNNNIYEIRCTIDILATYRPNISSYTAYVQRCASTYDGLLNDSAISVSSKTINMDTVETSIFPVTFNSVGSYVFPVLNAFGTQIIMTQHIEDFGLIFSPATYLKSDFNDWLTSGIAGLFDSNQFFGRVVWIPWALTNLLPTGVTHNNANTPISVGSIPFTLANESWTFAPDFLYGDLTSFTNVITKPTLAYNDFRDRDRKWTKFSIYLPAVGDFDLDPLVVGNPDIEIRLSTSFCPVDGSIKYRMRGYKNYGQQNEEFVDLGSYNGNLSYTVPWGDSQWGVKELVSSVLNNSDKVIQGGMGGAGATGGFGARSPGGAMGGIIGAVAGSVQAQLSNIKNTTLDFITSGRGTIHGGQGSLPTAKTELNAILSVQQFGTPDIPNTVAGRPLYQNRQLGNLSGYIECGNASLDIAGFEDEKIALNNFLNSGFYME